MTLEERNQALDRAKVLVLAGWTQGALARDNYGAKVGLERPSAVQFCAVGAVRRVSAVGSAGALWRALKDALVKLGYEPKISDYNDAPDRTKYEVAALFDQAKELPL